MHEQAATLVNCPAPLPAVSTSAIIDISDTYMGQFQAPYLTHTRRKVGCLVPSCVVRDTVKAGRLNRCALPGANCIHATLPYQRW
jgi:hypothetical protein